MHFFINVLSLLTLSNAVSAVTLYRMGGASKPYNQVRMPQDYDNAVDGIVPANPSKGVSSIQFVR